MLYVSLSGGVVQEAFVAALDARGVPLTHLLRPADAPAELVAWIRERGDRPPALGHGRRKGEFASLPLPRGRAAAHGRPAARSRVAWVLRRGGPVRIHVRAKDLRRPGRTDSVLAAIDTALGHVTPTTYGRPTRRVA